MIRAGLVGVLCAVAGTLSGSVAISRDAIEQLRARGAAERQRGDLLVAISTLRELVASSKALRDQLMLAETLAWAKQFAESERLYQAAVEQQPALREANLGLARVILWQGRYAEARGLFGAMLRASPSDAEILEGYATAAYWSGDLRSAEREFRRVLEIEPKRDFAATSFREIAGTTRPIDRFIVDYVRDDQPFENRRARLSTSLFTDPLTRWDLEAGAYSLYTRDDDRSRGAPYFLIGSTIVLPWQRLTLTPSIGAIRYPDGVTLPIGGLSMRLRLTARNTFEVAATQRELLTNVADRYRYSRHLDLRWERQTDRTLAAAHVGGIRYPDDNSGTVADAYVLAPIARYGRSVISAGVSAAYRDTRDSRFLPAVIESTRDAAFPSSFLYTYRGRYIPYWTPQRLREARAIVALETKSARAAVRLQIDGGRARDDGPGFAPFSGLEPLPSQIVPFSFPRTYSPWRLRLAANAEVRSGYFVEAAYEHAETIHYRANTVHASLARRR
jgi:hypothetical protein